MSDQQIEVEADARRSPWFLPVAILAMALLLVAIALSEDAVAPIDLADDPGPVIQLDSDLVSGAPPTNPTRIRPPVRPALRELVPGFDGTLHLWVHHEGSDLLLIWPEPLATPRPMELPEGTTRVDLDSQRLRTLVVTENRNGNGVLWLGDRNHVEPALIFDSPIDARWDAVRVDRLVVSRSTEQHTEVIVFTVQPGNVLVETQRLEVESGRVVEWAGDTGIALGALGGQPVAEWLTYDGQSTTHSRHLVQPGGLPIFDVCTGVPCRPTVRMYAAEDGTFVSIDPEVVQVANSGVWELAVTAGGALVRRSDGSDSISIPISGLNAWSTDQRWMAFEAEGYFVVVYDEEGALLGQSVHHPVGFIDLTGMSLHRVTVEAGQIKGIWLP